MLIQDQFGYFHEVPGQHYGGWGSPGFGEVYDGFGNPLGFPALAALLPMASKLLPMVSSLLPGLGPAAAPAPAPAPALPVPPQLPFSVPSMVPPQVIVIREAHPEEPPLPPAPVPAIRGRLRVAFRRRGRRY